MNKREDVIRDWVFNVFSKKHFELILLDGDASLRVYYRLLIGNKSYILMDSKKDLSLKKYLKIRELLFLCGITVPKIIEKNLKESILILTDFGDDLYLKQINIHNKKKLYLDALKSLYIMQTKFRNHSEDLDIQLENFSISYLSEQLNIFIKWYLEEHLQINLSLADRKFLLDLVNWFSKIFKNMPQTFVHLDYHSRNLLVLEKGSPGIIDFQDAKIGPSVYDLVSLFQDAYIFFPTKEIMFWLQKYNSLTKNTNLEYNNVEYLYRDFCFVGLQRHIKNLGIFARLFHQDKKSNYLKDIPLLLRYIKTTCDKYCELKDLAEFLMEKNIYDKNQKLSKAL